MFLQNARFFAKCKLHLARFAVDKAADAVGKRGGFMQFPMLWSECIQHGNPLSGRKRQLVNHHSLNIFSEILFYRLSLYISRLQMYSFGLNIHEISRF